MSEDLPGMHEQNWELLMPVFDWNVVTLEDCKRNSVFIL